MPAESAADTDRKTAALHALARERYESRPDPPEPQSPSLSYASLTRRTALTGVLGALGAALFASPAAADPEGILEGTSSGDPLLKIRANQIVLVERSSTPTAPSSGRVLLSTDGSDL